MRAFKQGVARRKVVRVGQTVADTNREVIWQYRDAQADKDIALLLYTVDIRRDQTAFSNSAIVTASWDAYMVDMLGANSPADGYNTIETYWHQMATTSTAVGINARQNVGSRIEFFDFAQSPNTPKILLGDRLVFGLTTTLTGLVNNVLFEIEYELVTMDAVTRTRLVKEEFG